MKVDLIIASRYLRGTNVRLSVREAFKKNNDETYGKFHILGGGGQQGVIFHMLSRKILNAQPSTDHRPTIDQPSTDI